MAFPSGGDLAKALRRANLEVKNSYVAVVNIGSDIEVPVFVAPFATIIRQVGFVPQAAITGADTDYFTLSFINKGSDGTGTDEIAAKDYTLGVDVAEFDFEDLGTLANNRLAKGDTVTFAKVETANGMATPQLITYILFERAL